jgi:hypothetical protein
MIAAILKGRAHQMRIALPGLLILFLAAACGGSGESSQNGGGASIGPPSASADISMLFMGNSHTSYNNLIGMVAAMVTTGRPQKTVAAVEAPGWMFLEERLNDRASRDVLASQNWTFVILQAQKYSTSGQFNYSTAEAKELIRLARERQAVPILFPEWPRRGVQETQRIYDLHVSIAQEQAACVAPIGQAWDLALARHPSMTLHDPDGNHSAPAGAFLTALILYATMTGLSPLDLPHLPQFSIDAGTQEALRGVADETVRMIPPRTWCPSDPVG